MTLQIFRSPSVSSSAITRGHRCINTRPLEFAQSIGESVGNCELQQQMSTDYLRRYKRR